LEIVYGYDAAISRRCFCYCWYGSDAFWQLATKNSKLKTIKKLFLTGGERWSII
jgi:hypothetical protein